MSGKRTGKPKEKDPPPDRPPTELQVSRLHERLSRQGASHRSSSTGRFVGKGSQKGHPKTTIVETPPKTSKTGAVKKTRADSGKIKKK